MPRSYLLAFLLAVASMQDSFGAWRQVYPEWVSPQEARLFLSIGSRREQLEDHQLGAGHFADTVLVGGRDGLVYVSRIQPEFVRPSRFPEGYWSYSNEWNPIRLDVAFSVTAVTASENHWIIAGPEGRIATHPFVSWDRDGKNLLKDNWDQSRIETSDLVRALASIDNQILALAGETLFVSTDQGQSWTAATSPVGVVDIEQHGDFLFAVSMAGSTVRLWRSSDGFNWNELWSVDAAAEGPQYKPDIFVLSDVLNAFERPVNQSTRLYVSVPVPESTNSGSGEPRRVLSSINGDSWADHTSIDYLPVPPHSGAPVSANLRLEGTEIQAYTGSDWQTKFQLNSEYSIRLGTVNQWGNLTFAVWESNTEVFVSISPDGSITRTPLKNTLPDQALRRPHVVVDGLYYGNYSPSPKETRIVATTDLSDLTVFALPQRAQSVRLIDAGNRLGVRYYYNDNDGQSGEALVFRDGESWTSPVYLPDGTVDIAYQSQSGLWYALVRLPFLERRDLWTEEYTIFSFDESGVFTEYATIFPQWANSLEKLSAPDRNTVVAHGLYEIIAVLGDGSIRNVDLGRYLSDPYGRITDIKFINGWYTTAGATVLRTKDFQSLEVLPVPNGQAIQDVMGFQGDLYAFTWNTVYKQKLERGYLDSIEHPDGWYHSDWLGWFTNPDESNWRVDHLILGETRVFQKTGQLGYLDTATLGYLEYHKEWMPWVRRQEDGLWIWIDFDGWPPRAWDADLGQWIDLTP